MFDMDKVAAERALRSVEAMWVDRGCTPGHGTPERTAIKRLLMTARRLGNSWPQLGRRLDVDPQTLRDGFGCLPRHGVRPADDVRRRGRGAGFAHDCHREGGHAERHACGEGERCGSGHGSDHGPGRYHQRRGHGPGQGPDRPRSYAQF